MNAAKKIVDINGITKNKKNFTLAHPNLPVIRLRRILSLANVFQEQHLPRYQEEGYAYLSTIPEVNRFLDTKLFETITLVRERIIADIFVLLEFDVVAPSLMPHPRARLLEHGLVKRQNLLHGGELKDGIRQTIGFFGSSLQIALNFRGQAATSDNRD